jgi:hypothetical protein
MSTTKLAKWARSNDHTALRAPPWAFTQHIVSTNVLSSPRGIGILAQSPTARPEGKEGDARVGPPPTH